MKSQKGVLACLSVIAYRGRLHRCVEIYWLLSQYMVSIKKWKQAELFQSSSQNCLFEKMKLCFPPEQPGAVMILTTIICKAVSFWSESLWTHITKITRTIIDIDLHCFPRGDISALSLFPSLGDSAWVSSGSSKRTHQYDILVINSALIHMHLPTGHVSSVITAVSPCVANPWPALIRRHCCLRPSPPCC